MQGTPIPTHTHEYDDDTYSPEHHPPSGADNRRDPGGADETSLAVPTVVRLPDEIPAGEAEDYRKDDKYGPDIPELIEITDARTDFGGKPSGERTTTLRRLYIIYCALTLTASFIALFFLGGDFIRNTASSGFVGDFLMSRVFGVSSDSDASTLIEIMLEQNFRGNKNRGEAVINIPAADGELPFIPDYLSGLDNPGGGGAAQLDPDGGAAGDKLYSFDYSLVPEGHLPIVPTDLSARHLGEYYLSNETGYSPDIRSIIENYTPPAVPAGSAPADSVTAGAISGSADGLPLVLIIHTHGTEAYAEDGSVSYSDSYNYARSGDTAKNVVAVGAAMAGVFNEAGVPALHCTIMHDEESYMDSYNRAAATIKRYLAEYPTIKYVFDVHRDSVIRANGEKIRPVTLCGGEVTAQVMSVVGTNDKGANHPNWMSNLTLASRLQERLNSSYGNLARPINLRGAAFNQQYTPGSLLLEIGSCGNTLGEAIRAGVIVARELAELIKES